MSGPERRAELGFNKHSFTICPGLAELITVPVFQLFRFTSMLLFPLGFPAR